MRIASIAEIKSRFSAFLKATEDGPVVVTRNGKPVAVLLHLDDETELERLILAYSPRFRSLLDKSLRQLNRGEKVRHEELWGKLETIEPEK
jgi:prevent-host-death family protein